MNIHTLRRHQPAAGLLSLLALGACNGSVAPEPSGSSLYALVQGIDGVYFLPPLGPEPAALGTFEADLLDGLSVALESIDAGGAVTPLATFDPHTEPAVALLGDREMYAVSVPAAAYLTDPAKTYRFRLMLDGAELATSVLTDRVFAVLAAFPDLHVGVHARIEGSGAVRAVSRRARQGGAHGTPLHCSDGVRNKDETGIDCGGSCRACETCSDGVQNQGEAGVDCGGPCSPCCTLAPAPSGYALALAGCTSWMMTLPEATACGERYYSSPSAGPARCWSGAPDASGRGDFFCSWQCNGGCNFSGRVTALYVLWGCPAGYSLSGGLCHASSTCH